MNLPVYCFKINVRKKKIINGKKRDVEGSFVFSPTIEKRKQRKGVATARRLTWEI